MNHVRIKYRDVERGMTLCLVTEDFCNAGIDGDVVLAEVSRLQHLYTVRVLHCYVSPCGRQLVMVLGVPTEALDDDQARDRCEEYDRKAQTTGFREDGIFPAVEPRTLWRLHAYDGEHLNSLDCFMHDLAWIACYQTCAKRRLAGDLFARRPQVRGKYRCKYLDPRNMPRTFSRADMKGMRKNLARAKCHFRLNWGTKRLYGSTYAVGEKKFVRQVMGLAASPGKEVEDRQIKVIPFTEDALWHLLKHTVALYREQVNHVCQGGSLSELTEATVSAVANPGKGVTNMAMLSLAVTFAPALAALWITNGAIRCWTKHRLLSDGTLRKCWEDAARQAKADYGMEDAPTPSFEDRNLSLP